MQIFFELLCKRFDVLACFVIIVLVFNVDAQELSSMEEILTQMELANNYFMAKWPDPGAPIVTDKTRPSNLWTRATYFEGLMALYRINKDQKLFNYAVNWGKSHNWQPAYGDLSTRDGDHQCCGQTYIELYQISGDTNWIVPIKKNIDNMVDDADADDWSWIDAIQMSMPVFAKLGAVLNDTKYFDKMYDLWNFSKKKHGDNGLYNEVDHLWWRDATFDPSTTTPNGKPMYWSRGNGWVMAALVRVLEVLPKDQKNRDEYSTVFKEMSAALSKLQRNDGYWNCSLVDPNHFGGKESSGTAFFVYGLAWGINNGFLDSATYVSTVIKGWEGMIDSTLHGTGALGYVQSTGKEPKDGQPVTYTKMPNFEDYGLGAFLLAGSEVYTLAQGGKTQTHSSPKNNSLKKNSFSVYLNPTKDVLIINSALPVTSHVKVELFNSMGKKIYGIKNGTHRTPGFNSLHLNLHSDFTFNHGIYFIKLTASGMSETAKVIIK